MWRILKQHRIDPAPRRTSLTWTQFLRSQAAVACDFVTVDTALLRRCCLLFFIDVTNREVLYGGTSLQPSSGLQLCVSRPHSSWRRALPGQRSGLPMR
ncbi:hypothetical protein [Candidatus Poriferisodalis sp.]|uniref:hypothetical protein n=1 Tax=Candidatus Poriferisodalis sp. TaxID=3101277 RepID=UPI003B0129D1